MRYLAVCAIVKDEAAHIAEWAAFHLAAGADHLLLFDNGSTDATLDVIEGLPFRRQITLERRPQHPAQLAVYFEAAERWRRSFRWIAFIDTDEFLFGAREDDLKAILADYEAHAALCVPWSIYGSSGHRARPAGLTIESYLHRAEDDFEPNDHVKTIADPSQVLNCISPHTFSLKGDAIDECHRILPRGGADRFPWPASRQRLRLNHYFTRSRHDWEVKVARGRASCKRQRPRRMFATYDRNEVFDPVASRFVPAVHALLRRTTGAQDHAVG